MSYESQPNITAINALVYLLNKQSRSVVAQPPDANHTRLSKEVIDMWAKRVGGSTVLDVGCGQGFAKEQWEEHGYEWTGQTIGPDYGACANKGLNVLFRDMHIASGNYGVVYARHVLEHSPVPMVALEAWKRVAPFMIVVVPMPTYTAMNNKQHLSVLSAGNLDRMFEFLDLEIVEEHGAFYDDHRRGGEYRFLLRGPK